MTIQSRIAFAARIAGWHFLASILLALMVAALVFFVWYPYPLREVTGSFKLFWLLVGIDVVCGPIMTFILANPKKSRREMFVDLALVISIQIAAFIYGMYHVFESRPVAVVFEVDRLRVLTPADIALDELLDAPQAYQSLPIFGYFMLSTREAKGGDDRLDAIETALSGFDIGQRPSWWQAYGQSRSLLLERSAPISDLNAVLTEEQQQSLDRAVAQIDQSAETLRYIPLVSARHSNWIALLDDDLSLVGAAPIDSFTLKRTKNDASEHSSE